MTQGWDGGERRRGKDRRSGKDRRMMRRAVPLNRRSGKDRRSGLDRRNMSRNLCPYIEKPECTPWRERTLGCIIHISRYCRDYYIFCEYYKQLESERGGAL